MNSRNRGDLAVLLATTLFLVAAGCGGTSTGRVAPVSPSITWRPAMTSPAPVAGGAPAEVEATAPEPDGTQPLNDEPEPEGAPPAPVSETRTEDGLEVTLTATPGALRAGEEFLLELTIRNPGDRKREFTQPSSQAFEFKAYDHGGGEAWCWSNGLGFLFVITDVTLEPGQAYTCRETWNTAGLAPGDYVIEGYVTIAPTIVPRVSVGITPAG